MRKINLLKVGVSEGMDAEFRRVTILTNVVYVLIFFLLLPYLVYFLPNYLNLERWTLRAAVPWIAWFSAVIGYVLNAWGRYLLSRLFFVLIWIWGVTILPIVTGGNHVVALFMHPFYCMVSSVIVQLLFSQKRERALYFFFLTLVWALIIFSYEFIMYYNPDLNVEAFFPQGFFRWRLVIVMIAAFFNGSIIYLMRLNHDFYSALKKRNDTILEQYRKLEHQRKDLELLKEQLEEKVHARTQLLLQQNNQLREYTFFNSHILRAPVSRIRGLLNLLSVESSRENELLIRQRLAESMAELDQAIKSINDKLQQVELLEDPA
ncbi:MAG: hypothetical protein KF775_17225 [Cyclobacteriaceae bacterium]|nr:hypothetical protein [Cyclobacteriaceae bacterium]